MLPRSKMMTETDPLLPRAERPAYDFPILLHVCHSSWPFISQKGLLTVRATVASSLSILLALNIFYAIENTQRRRQLAFEASNVSLLLQILYYWITTSWTLQHILRPCDQLSRDEQAKGSFLTHLQAGLSAPRSTDTNSKSYCIFSTFYTTIVTIPFVVSITYWLVLYHSDPVLGPGAKCEALQRFTLISITTLNSAIAFVEVMVLSSVRVQQDLATEVVAVIAMYFLYAIWTVFGRFVTGEYVYKYLDPDYGWRAITTTDMVVMSLTVTTILAQRMLHMLRELLVWKVGHDRK